MRDQPVPTKAVVSVAEMARMCSLSRARFYQLVQEGVFPPPVYDVRTRRPQYPEPIQRACLDVRRRNCGANGQPVLFYARGSRPAPRPKPTTKAKPGSAPRSGDRHADLIDGLKGLGLAGVTSEQVEAALRATYPSGTDGVDRGAVLRAVFLFLKRRD